MLEIRRGERNLHKSTCRLSRQILQISPYPVMLLRHGWIGMANNTFIDYIESGEIREIELPIHSIGHSFRFHWNMSIELLALRGGRIMWHLYCDL